MEAKCLSLFLSIHSCLNLGLLLLLLLLLGMLQSLLLYLLGIEHLLLLLLLNPGIGVSCPSLIVHIHRLARHDAWLWGSISRGNARWYNHLPGLLRYYTLLLLLSGEILHIDE